MLFSRVFMQCFLLSHVAWVKNSDQRWAKQHKRIYVQSTQSTQLLWISGYLKGGTKGRQQYLRVDAVAVAVAVVVLVLVFVLVVVVVVVIVVVVLVVLVVLLHVLVLVHPSSPFELKNCMPQQGTMAGPTSKKEFCSTGCKKSRRLSPGPSKRKTVL